MDNETPPVKVSAVTVAIVIVCLFVASLLIGRKPSVVPDPDQSTPVPVKPAPPIKPTPKCPVCPT